MKTLTICQPYAELILLGQKLVENRTWPTNHRGPIGIHAGKSRDWLKTYEPLPGKMEFGALVGFAELWDCLPIAAVRRDRKLASQLAPHAEGPFCWLLRDVKRLWEPHPMPGKQGLFDVADWIFEGADVDAGPRCRVCGCTQDNACPEGCEWVEHDLCSACVGADPDVEHPLFH